MGALSYVLPFSLLYLLPSVPTIPNIGKMAVTAVDQLKNFVGGVNVPTEITYEIVDGTVLDPEQRFPIGYFDPRRRTAESVSDATKLNVGFRAKMESKSAPLLADHRAAISTDVQYGKEAKWSRSVPLGVHQVFPVGVKVIPSEEERIENANNGFKIRTESSKDITTKRNRGYVSVFHPYIVDVKDTLREKFAKTNLLHLDTDVGVAGKTNALAVDIRAKSKRNYIQLCKRFTGPRASLMQKLHGKDCVMLPMSEFYLEDTRDGSGERDGELLLGLKKIVTRTNNSGKDYKDRESKSEDEEYKQRDDVEHDASISDDSSNYDESTVKVNKLNVRAPMIDGRIGGKLLDDDKLSLSAALGM